MKYHDNTYCSTRKASYHWLFVEGEEPEIVLYSSDGLHFYRFGDRDGDQYILYDDAIKDWLCYSYRQWMVIHGQVKKVEGPPTRCHDAIFTIVDNRADGLGMVFDFPSPLTLMPGDQFKCYRIEPPTPERTK